MICPECKQSVGRLRMMAPGDWKCLDCAPLAKPVQNADPGHFPFTTTNMHPNGEKTTVRSLRELHKMENRYGVQSSAWN